MLWFCIMTACYSIQSIIVICICVQIMGYATVESVSVMKVGLGNPVSTRSNVPSPAKPVKTSVAMPRV